MRSTLFYIPHEIAGMPLFGFGIVLAMLSVAFLAWLVWSFLSKRPLEVVWSGLPVWAIAAAIVAFVLPMVEQTWPDGTPIGLPIRGYGVMVVLGLMTGIGITVFRGSQLGIDADKIIGLGFWSMVCGVLGARLFFVVQKWEEFGGQSLADKAAEVVKITEGGLVIYGGVIGGLLAGFFYCRRHELKIAATADLIAPGFLIGLSLGRIGCLLHGCCFGGVCTSDLPKIQFPVGSGPYVTQVESGRLMGITTESRELPAKITGVDEGSLADRASIAVEQTLADVRWRPRPVDKNSNPVLPPRIDASLTVDGRVYPFPAEDLPDKSLPVHPTQLYSALNALFLCGLIWLLQPFPNRDGIAFCVAIILYATSRFLLEGIRSDEAGQLGTGLTISQWVALCSFFLSICLLLFIQVKQPAGRAWGW